MHAAEEMVLHLWCKTPMFEYPDPFEERNRRVGKRGICQRAGGIDQDEPDDGFELGNQLRSDFKCVVSADGPSTKEVRAAAGRLVAVYFADEGGGEGR